MAEGYGETTAHLTEAWKQKGTGQGQLGPSEAEPQGCLLLLGSTGLVY